ncbi:MAG: hypothetical protein IT432_13860 [Phycisphaerales bacterium]|nr:hypothetical protein [Phycisphaerales bacterium]
MRAASALSIIVLFVAFIPGCAKGIVGKDGPDPAATISAASSGIEDSASKIDVARHEATAKAPEVQPESDRIGVETDRLRQYRADLDIAVRNTTALRKANAELDRKLKEAVENAERERTGLMRWIFGIMAALALVGAVAAVLWLKNMPLAITCGGVVAACIGATYLLEWAKWLALGLLVVMAAVTVYALWRQWKTGKELVLTAEAFKKVDPADKAAIERAAEQIQTEATKAFVRIVRNPIKKKLAERAAFGLST